LLNAVKYTIVMIKKQQAKEIWLCHSAMPKENEGTR